MTLAKPILGEFLPEYKKENDEDAIEVKGFEGLTRSGKVKNVRLFLLLAIGILGLSVGLSLLLHGGTAAITIILSVTTLGIVLSFVKENK